MPGGHEPLVGLAATRTAVGTALKLGGRGGLLVTALRSRRRGRWLALGAVGVAADVLMSRRLADRRYLPGLLRYAAETADAALWAAAAGDGSGRPAPVLMVDSAGSAAEAGWRIGAGTSARPVYDPSRPWPPRTAADTARAVAQVAVPVLGPYGALWLVRRAHGLRTHWSNLSWGLGSALFGFAFARNRARLQQRTVDRWTRQARDLVDHERTAARFFTVAQSSPGHDFKKTLFALGLWGSSEARAAATAQGARPGDLYRQLPGQLLAEASHRARIDPPEQGLRLLSAGQAQQLQRFLADTAEQAPDGLDQTVQVRDLDGFTTQITYLGRRLHLRHDPPPLAAELNPTAGSFLIGAVLKAHGLLPHTTELGVPLSAVLAAVDAAGFVHFWRRPVTATSLDSAVRRAALGAACAIAAAATPLAHLRDGDGGELYPAIGAARDLLLVLLPNWDLLRGGQKALAPLAVAGALAASVVRRRQVGVDWLSLIADLGSLVDTLAMLRAASRAEEEAVLLERAMFDRYSAAVRRARQAGQHQELASYAEQLRLARRVAAELADLDPALRQAVDADCDRLQAWLAHQGVDLDAAAQPAGTPPAQPAGPGSAPISPQ